MHIEKPTRLNEHLRGSLLSSICHREIQLLYDRHHVMLYDDKTLSVIH